MIVVVQRIDIAEEIVIVRICAKGDDPSRPIRAEQCLRAISGTKGRTDQVQSAADISSTKIFLPILSSHSARAYVTLERLTTAPSFSLPSADHDAPQRSCLLTSTDSTLCFCGSVETVQRLQRVPHVNVGKT